MFFLPKIKDPRTRLIAGFINRADSNIKSYEDVGLSTQDQLQCQVSAMEDIRLANDFDRKNCLDRATKDMLDTLNQGLYGQIYKSYEALCDTFRANYLK